MTRIHSTTQIVPDWTERFQDEVRNHPAWHGSLSEQGAEEKLQSSPPFTYLLRAGEKEYAYFISFVKEDGGVKHQWFVLEHNRKGWYYRNGCQPDRDSFHELQELIPCMMHCTPFNLSPLSSP